MHCGEKKKEVIRGDLGAREGEQQSEGERRGGEEGRGGGGVSRGEGTREMADER